MNIEQEHSPDEIRKRLATRKGPSDLGNVVLGAIDGCVTTFAVVSGVSGGKLPASVAVLLGIANLLADGFSMAVSNYQRAKSEKELIENARRREERHIEQIPAGEREEVRQIFEAKGFREPMLSALVDGITQNKRLWINTMLTEELGLPLEGPNPWRASIATFLAFLGVGSIPLLPFLFGVWIPPSKVFLLSALLTGIAFFTVGIVKGTILERSRLRSALETLFVGGGAALLAYGAGVLLRDLVGGL